MKAAQPILPRRRRRDGFFRVAAILAAVLIPAIAARAATPPTQPVAVDLDYWEYQSLVQAAARLDHLAVIDPPSGVVGLYLAIGDRLYWLSTGAYTTTYSAVEFNGFPPLKDYYI